jgi:DNA polymerase elongation subunit (family B)
MDVLLSLSNEYAYFRDQGPVKLSELGHDPWFWAIPKKGQDANATLRRVREAWQKNQGGGGGFDADLNPLSKIKAIGDLTDVRSFVDHGKRRPAFPVYAKRSFQVPEISDELFYGHDVFTAEHDVPYQQRACVDLAAQGKAWAFDTKGHKTKLKVLVYDIETTQYGKANQPRSVPVDMIGYSEFEISYEASKDLDKEEFHFNLVDAPPRWQDCEVVQLSARSPDEEVDNLLKFIRRIPNYQIISGHNILAFDNKQVLERIRYHVEQDDKNGTLSPNARRAFEEFGGRPIPGSKRWESGKWAAEDRTFTFGQQNDTVNFHPTSLDTYHATRRFYFFLDDFTLKKVAPFLGVVVPNRVYLSPQDLKIDDPKTLAYNKHDCQEQLGITMLLLAQALPLAFTTGWTFEEVLTGGNVRMWDHMAAIRAARQKKLLPATCRAQGIARTVLQNVGTRPTKEMIADDARSRMREPQPPSWLKEYVRVAKYGDEMPDWMELPHAIVNPRAVNDPTNSDMTSNGDESGEEEQDYLSYAIPGGMTIHPQEVQSQFVPWWYVVDADVGAMYPTILRARNVGPDTVRLARAGETPDDWVWLYKINEDFAKDERFVFRAVGPEENFAKPDQGVMVGVKIAKEPGLVPLAMKGIMGIATKLKRQLGAAKKNPSVPKSEVDRLNMAYASIKATRNAGTHGQMLAVNVSCRGFNLWAGAEITTIGQKILADSLVDLKKIGARVVYGDTDGIYLACSKSGRNILSVSEALNDTQVAKDDGWILQPEAAFQAIDALNAKWRQFLGYEEFELEAGHHDAMLFVVHKNYLIFDVKNGKLRMQTKGNNFRGSDKAPIAQKALEAIMVNSLRDLIEWDDEEKARESMKAAIKRYTQEAIKTLDPTASPIEDLTLIQVVQPADSYARVGKDGGESSWTKRARALEQVTGERLRTSKKYRFVVCKKPLPGIDKPSAKGLKPLDYMWPLEALENPKWKGQAEIDLAWYKDMITKYVRGAFGFEDLELHAQKGLDAWM